MSHVTIMIAVNVAETVVCSTGSSLKGVPSSGATGGGMSRPVPGAEMSDDDILVQMYYTAQADCGKINKPLNSLRLNWNWSSKYKLVAHITLRNQRLQCLFNCSLISPICTPAWATSDQVHWATAATCQPVPDEHTQRLVRGVNSVLRRCMYLSVSTQCVIAVIRATSLLFALSLATSVLPYQIEHL